MRAVAADRRDEGRAGGRTAAEIFRRPRAGGPKAVANTDLGKPQQRSSPTSGTRKTTCAADARRFTSRTDRRRRTPSQLVRDRHRRFAPSFAGSTESGLGSMSPQSSYWQESRAAWRFISEVHRRSGNCRGMPRLIRRTLSRMTTRGPRSRRIRCRPTPVQRRPISHPPAKLEQRLSRKSVTCDCSTRPTMKTAFLLEPSPSSESFPKID